MPQVSAAVDRTLDYARRGANEFGVYVGGVVRGRVPFDGGEARFRFARDPADGKWRGSFEVYGPLSWFYLGSWARVSDAAHESVESAVREQHAAARAAVESQRDRAENDFQLRRIDFALRRLDGWAARNLQRALVADAGAATVG